MTRNEAKMLVAVIQNAYPNYKPIDINMTIETWFRVLEHDDYQLMMNALQVYIRTDSSGFAPTVGQLMNLIATESVVGLTEGEIRDLLTRASRNANYGAETEFAKLPPELRDAVGSPSVIRSWGMDTPENLDYEFGRIIKTYQRMIAEERKSFITPTSLRTDNRLGVESDNLLGQGDL